MAEILDVPKPEWDWCWLRCRSTKRSKWRVYLVEQVVVDDIRYVRPHEDNNQYPPHFFAAMEWQFTEAVPPPLEWRD